MLPQERRGEGRGRKEREGERSGVKFGNGELISSLD